MAALADDEKQQDRDFLIFKATKLPKWEKKDIKSLDDDSKKLLKHKCKYTVGKDGVNVTFMPSPHLYDKNGNYDFTKDQLHCRNEKNDGWIIGYTCYDQEISINDTCSFAAGILDCDKVESTFVDQFQENKEKDQYKNIKLIGSQDRVGNGFLHACELAWAEHFPLKLEPIHIWLTILQSVALHINQNAEKLREKWVKHKGKQDLTIIRNGFVKGLFFFGCFCLVLVLCLYFMFFMFWINCGANWFML